jgi:polyisoprenoid-binding protein YceI
LDGRKVIKIILAILIVFLLVPRADAHPTVDHLYFAFDQGHSEIRFTVSASLFKIWVSAKKFKGRILLSTRGGYSVGEVELEIEGRSLDAHHQYANERMKNRYLEVNRYPLIRFQSYRVGSEDHALGEAKKVDVVGLLDLHGLSREIHIPISYRRYGDTLVARGKVRLKMSDFEIERPYFLVFRTRDVIELSLDIQARRVREKHFKHVGLY